MTLDFLFRYLEHTSAPLPKINIKKKGPLLRSFFGAGDEARTRYLHLGKVALYRMSYTRGTSGIIADISQMSSPKRKIFN